MILFVGVSGEDIVHTGIVVLALLVHTLLSVEHARLQKFVLTGERRKMKVVWLSVYTVPGPLISDFTVDQVPLYCIGLDVAPYFFTFGLRISRIQWVRLRMEPNGDREDNYDFITVVP